MKENLVVITGGSKGLGFELVKLFSKKSKVLVISRTKNNASSGNVFYECGNIADEQFVKNVYNKYSKEYKISYLINNAGCGVFGKSNENTLAKVNQVLDSNLVGMILNTTCENCL